MWSQTSWAMSLLLHFIIMTHFLCSDRGTMYLGSLSNSCEHNISAPWGNYVKIGANIRLDSTMNRFSWSMDKIIDQWHNISGMPWRNFFKMNIHWDSMTNQLHIDGQWSRDLTLLPFLWLGYLQIALKEFQSTKIHTGTDKNIWANMHVNCFLTDSRHTTRCDRKNCLIQDKWGISWLIACTLSFNQWQLGSAPAPCYLII